MNTERLYYQDPYLREFAARVIARQPINGKPAVALDRTAFYPTGGGQPNDMGTLNGVPVSDVIADDGAVWHVVGADLPGGTVSGTLDWSRRFDHMQQHTGQHILSQAFIVGCNAETVAFHLGAAVSSIDLNRTDLGPDALAAVEAAANGVIDDARPVTATFVTQDELARLPLRKPPKVTEAIRIVQVGGFDWSACGGTHVADSAQIGLIKITGVERRGAELRVSFLCGRRARADYTRLQALASGLAARFTCAQDEVPDAVERLAREHQAGRKTLDDLETQWVEATAAAWWAAGQPFPVKGTPSPQPSFDKLRTGSPCEGRGVPPSPAGRGGQGGEVPTTSRRLIVQAVDAPVERAKKLAQALRARAGAVVLLGVRGERPQLIFTRADDVALNMGDLLRTAAAAGGGRGGGRPDWAQGGAPTNEGLDIALAVALEKVTK